MKKSSLARIGFLQAAGLAAYVGLVATLISHGEQLGEKVNNFWGPLLFLSLFVFSASVCALIFAGYPFWLVWEKKQTKQALSLVFYTLGWLFVFVLLLIGYIILR